MKTALEIHVLQNFAPSNLNRDDTGAPKDAMFGGTRRARISSQCLKRSSRQHFKSLVERGVLAETDIADRTKRVLEMLVASLVAKGKPEAEAAEKTRLALAAIGLSIKEDNKSEYLLFLGKREVDGVAEVILHKWETLVAPEKAPEGKKGGKAKKDAAKNADPELKKSLEKLFDGGKAIDVALFGRMLADMPEKNQNAACQVAHAISTHTVDREFDFYTAVDDRKPEDSAGADMMGTVEFNSACFYRYAVIDWESLVANLQGDRELAKKGVKAFLDGFVTAEPTGKQNSFAAHNPPEFVAITVSRDSAPINLANAFETGVRNEKDKTLTAASAIRLVEKAKILAKAYSRKSSTFVLNLVDINVAEFGTPKANLDEVIEAVMQKILSE